jgi:hypothetical protein
MNPLTWTNLKTAVIAGLGAWLTAAAATGAAQQAITNDAKSKTSSAAIALPPEVRQHWAKQKAALHASYFEFTETDQGTLANWDYGVAPVYSAYFAGRHFYQHERIPGAGYEVYEHEIAFDGQAIWGRGTTRVVKCSLADAPALAPAVFNSKRIRWPYLDAAGIYVPQYGSEVGPFSSLEPLGLHCLEHSGLIKVEAVGENLRVTFQVEDELAAVQKAFLEKPPGELQGTTAPKKDALGKEDVKTPAVLKASRTVALLLDPKHGYGIAEREEWNPAGQRIVRLQSEEWRFYEGAGLWLPSRCVAFYYARPREFVSEFSEQPIHFVTNELKRVEFGEKDIPFTFEPAKSGEPVVAVTTPKAPLAAAIPLAAEENVDVATAERIKTEVRRHSQVMDIASWLTDVYGPRLTGSRQTQAAADWAVATMRSWGLSRVQLEPWGPYERGWRSEQFSFRAIAPQPFIIHALPAVWSISTKGRLTGPAIKLEVHSFADLQRYAGKLNGAFLLMDAPRPTPAHFEPQATRLSDLRLAALAAEEPPRHVSSNAVEELRYASDRVMEDPAARRWLVDEGAAALLFTASGDGGTIFMWGNGGSGWLSKNEPGQLPVVKVSAESYGRLVRILEKNLQVTLELEMKNTFYDNPNVFNLIAEIPGTDPQVKDEVVLLGAHFDSWTFGTGATDDAAGSAMVMEAMRVLKALNLQPRRTIRIALWTGEEQGALGSEAYVARHYRELTRHSPTTKPEHGSFSVYFNVDGGTGKIRGLLNARNRAVWPIFEAWMLPFREMGMKTVSPWNIGGGDQNSFEQAGLPSFGFIQDPIEYESRTHHSSADVYERLQPEDLQFNTVVLATFAWQAAQREEKFPR